MASKEKKQCSIMGYTFKGNIDSILLSFDPADRLILSYPIYKKRTFKKEMIKVKITIEEI